MVNVMTSEEKATHPPRAVALAEACAELRSLANAYEDVESVSFADLLSMSDEELRHRQQVNAYLREMADEMEREAVSVVRSIPK